MGFRYVGTISREYGTQGEIILSECPDPALQLHSGTKVLLGYSAQFAKEYTILQCSPYKNTLKIQLQGVQSSDIKSLRETGIFVDEQYILRKNEQYYISEIIGCSVVNQAGEHLGIISDVWIMPANDVWVMKTEQGEIPLPVIDDVIISTDISNKTITVYMMEGLLDLARQHAKEDDEY